MQDVAERPRIRETVHPGQSRLIHDQRHAEIAVISGMGYGKTHIGARWHFARCCQNPKAESVIIAPDHKLLKHVCFKALLEYFHALGYREGHQFEWNRSEMVIRLSFGHTIYGLTGGEPKAIAGYNLSHAWVDEAARCKVEVKEQLVGRMRSKVAKFIQRLYTSTPEGMNWLYDLFSPDTLTRAGRYSFDDRRLVLHGRTSDNPSLPASYIESMRATFGWDSALFDAYFNGNWVSLSKNRFYHSFGPKNETDLTHDDSIRRFVLTWDFNVDQSSWAVIQERVVNYEKNWIVTRANKSDAADVAHGCRQFMQAFPPDRYRDCAITVLGDASGHKRSHVTHVTGYDVIESELRPHYPHLRVEAPRNNPEVWERKMTTNQNLAASLLLINRGCTKVLQSLRMAESDGKRGIKKTKDDTITHAMEAVDMAMVVLDPLDKKTKQFGRKSFTI